MAKAIYQGVSGVARKVKQPFVGVSGVARKVKNAFVGVGGVARGCYESVVYTTIKITVPVSTAANYATSLKGLAYVIVNGTEYAVTGVSNAPWTVQVPIGSTIQCYANFQRSSSSGCAEIRLNGQLHATTNKNATWTNYNYVVTGPATIALNGMWMDNQYATVMYGYIDITTT